MGGGGGGSCMQRGGLFSTQHLYLFSCSFASLSQYFIDHFLQSVDFLGFLLLTDKGL